MRVVLVIQVRLYRESLVRALGAHPHLEVVGAAGGASEAGELVDRHRPETALVDVQLATKAGLVERLRQRHPVLKVIAFGITDEPGEVVRCAEAGVAGYVPGGADLNDLVEIIEATGRGELRCSAAAAGLLLRRVNELARGGVPAAYVGGPDAPGPLTGDLTARELEIVELIGSGLMNKEIARRLGISLSTVKNHVHRILEKHALTSRMQLASRYGRALQL